MAIIDPKGLFNGDRLLACSDKARLYWPYLFLGCNGYGRLELSYTSIISQIFVNFRNPPNESELWQIFSEYAENCLVILYEANGTWWAQFSTSEKFLPKFKTRRDEISPDPPTGLLQKFDEDYVAWKKARSFKSNGFHNFSEISEKFRPV